MFFQAFCNTVAVALGVSRNPGGSVLLGEKSHTFLFPKDCAENRKM